ncbi:MAG: hypothetical protein V1846_00135 [Candidatus Komeilibacteria bacterium]
MSLSCQRATDPVKLLKRNRIKVPITVAAQANLADFIQIGNRSMVMSRKTRIEKIRQAQEQWIGQRVKDKGGNRFGRVLYLRIRNSCNDFDAKDRVTPYRIPFLAYVIWDYGPAKSVGLSTLELVAKKGEAPCLKLKQ